MSEPEKTSVEEPVVKEASIMTLPEDTVRITEQGDERIFEDGVTEIVN